jgi:hypothetical protein
MKEQIIYVKGVSCPYTQEKVKHEALYVQQCVGLLEQGGHEVIRVGNGVKGFYMRHLERAMRDAPRANLILVDAHGNIEDKRHYLAARHEKSSHIFAKDFYRGLADYSDCRPLNVFMSSCGSGNGCLDGITQLPLGSTLVNVAQEDQLYSYIPSCDFLNVGSGTETPLAEQLFLNLLGKGYPDATPYYPQLCISTANPNEGYLGHVGYRAHACAGRRGCLSAGFRSKLEKIP